MDFITPMQLGPFRYSDEERPEISNWLQLSLHQRSCMSSMMQSGCSEIKHQIFQRPCYQMLNCFPSFKIFEMMLSSISVKMSDALGQQDVFNNIADSTDYTIEVHCCRWHVLANINVHELHYVYSNLLICSESYLGGDELGFLQTVVSLENFSHM